MFSLKTLSYRMPSVTSLALVGAIGIGVSACSEEKAEVKQVVRPVKVVEIAKAGDTRKLDYSGSVKARTEMNLGFRVAGKITERLVDIGDRVTPGDVLARVDATDYQLAVRTAEANLAAAERGVETTDLVNKRAEQLFDKSVAPKSQVEQASLSHDQAISQRDAALSALDQAKNQVSYTELKAGQNGIVTAINADTGQVVGSGTAVVTVAVDGEKEVQIAVPENDIAEFKPGKTVKASFWADDRLVLDGKVREVSGSADQQSRTFAVRVSLPNDPQVLLGMTATIEANVSNGNSYVSIPLSALAEKDGKKMVWTVDRDTSTVHGRDIKVADFTGDGVHVIEGLDSGDLVVAAGTQFMSENLKVKVPDQQSALAATDQTVR
ncbi:efflux transporter periplasmic adaptor subunit [Rhizobium anhuiense]|jgi:multidrug efflux system membrane fusion protein|uniref:Efflux RND transporter periplasmic adaptor subunit n=1 Tax=Rhizobium anhuiense TaxID=1184720 RepID=A0A432NMI2_9HYPH|nr:MULTISPECIES: efflux RND transporter periplasmic adaptor subunit [Rhizobium]MBB4217434.1 RND family efflux transporter MFP subunit [Rhizobium sp. BK212]PDS44045.1 efflux transporter periplasmic adaptor subunit [Rhizobium anhuiense]PDS51689.1 efflux transporter periplasmic adaptor subunit [Rhizobium anhuiense]RUM00857.1 efflux RND transporter periplasmic adaptor subunit [Rhizobium anhuiense]UTS90841.1 efflux RND transporter periplasmic adaptor subunit [Rhizobium anhuiense bv. trifolii]